MNEENSLVKFVFEQHNRMSCIMRFNNTPTLFPESVAEHSYYVTFLVMLIGDYLTDRGIYLDKGKLVRMAVLHDLEEIISGDIIKILKAGDFKDALDKLNQRSMQYLCSILGAPRASEYFQLWIEAKEKQSLEARIVDMADLLSCMVYCVKEIHCGNRYFKEILVYASGVFSEFNDVVPKSGELIMAFIDYVRKYLADDKDVIDAIDGAVRVDKNDQRSKKG